MLASAYRYETLLAYYEKAFDTVQRSQVHQALGFWPGPDYRWTTKFPREAGSRYRAENNIQAYTPLSHT